MKKNYLFLGVMSLIMATTSCSQEETYPSKPKNGEKYVDQNGNNCVWNAAMNYWIISSMVNGRNVTHYYYPSNNSYTNSTGAKVSRPANIPAYKTGGFGSSARSSSAS